MAPPSPLGHVVSRKEPLPFRFRWRPVHFSVPATVVTQEAVAGFAARIGQGDEGDGCLVVGARRLFVKEMRFRHQGDGGDIPRGLMFLFAGDLLDHMTTFAGGFVGLNASAMRSVVGDGHRASAAGGDTSQVLVLERLNKPAMSFAFLFRFHWHSSLS